jgi:hypothetical protein
MRNLRMTPWIGAISLILLAATPARAAPPCTVSLTASLDFQLPPDDAGCPRSSLETFSHLAWQTFKYLVWPASDVMRGDANENRTLADMTGPRVFETYKSDWEIFPDRPAIPMPWNTYPTTATVCRNEPPIAYPASKLILGSPKKFGNITLPDLDFVAVLVAQNGKPVRYLAGFDQKEFSLIETGQLHVPSNVPPQSGEAPSELVTAKPGTIFVKSAWVEMDGLAAADVATFHTRRALVQDLKGQCKETLVGLVGLHVVQKTAYSPQWIWASFEHVRNAPLRGAGRAAGFTFNDGTGTPMPSNPPLNSRNPMGSGWVVPPPYNVERLADMAPDIAAVNTAWQASLAGSVWANYELAVVQWPGVQDDPTRNGLNALPTPPCFGHADTNLVNTTMETFLQPHISCADVFGPPPTTPRATCMGCHNGARSSDFVWAIKLNANTAAGPMFPPTRRSGLEYLRSITGDGNR